MITKIRLFFLKRKWFVLHKQIVFLKSEFNMLKSQCDQKIREMAAETKGVNISHAFSFHQFLRIRPLMARIEQVEDKLFALTTKKSDIRFCIKGLEARASFDVQRCVVDSFTVFP